MGQWRACLAPRQRDKSGGGKGGKQEAHKSLLG